MTSLPDFECHSCTHSIDTHSLGEPCGVGGTCACVQTPRDIAAYHLSRPDVSATLVKVNENFGDHGQDVRTAVQIAPGEAVDELARRLLRRGHHPVAEHDWYIEVRLVLPVEQTRR